MLQPVQRGAQSPEQARAVSSTETRSHRLRGWSREWGRPGGWSQSVRGLGAGTSGGLEPGAGASGGLEPGARASGGLEQGAGASEGLEPGAGVSGGLELGCPGGWSRELGFLGGGSGARMTYLPADGLRCMAVHGRPFQGLEGSEKPTGTESLGGARTHSTQFLLRSGVTAGVWARPSSCQLCDLGVTCLHPVSSGNREQQGRCLLGSLWGLVRH